MPYGILNETERKNSEKRKTGVHAMRINLGNVASVANRPKFLPQNAKMAPEKYQRPKKSAAEFSADLM
jgi:hypothetical protein